MSIIEPSTFGSFAGSGIGCPFASTPLAQLPVPANGLETRFSPVGRSSTKNQPQRAPCASSLRFLPSIVASNSTGVSTLSQSCVSCGDAWKYQTSLPGVRIQRHDGRGPQIRALAALPAKTGFALPVPQYSRFNSGS